ncbi:hypothetical protein CLV98_101435 [Dyadobacter jejuensis]|uniref:Uncharacterized protein n=1 Tax=Dyadobacter jejuensis TaxID=1082580 RepID=A0A316ASL5_9BACT|nr:hypothetical protein [Dyadobacter jejuensis]PWJ60254.1 hypothetical protein CLV98_101435 [Dyadobacter jejuensis]
MSNGLNSNAIQQYATGFATLVLNEAYDAKNIISGGDLLKLTPVRQVNLGVLNRLFETWKGNAESFRSAYFDFENESVKQALSSFMNTVSQHIAVKRADLEPLLVASTIESLELLLVPAKYFKEKIITRADEGFSYAVSEQLFKYTHIHKAVAEKLAHQLAASGQTSVKVSEAISWLDGALEAKEEALEGYVSQFSEIRNLNLSDFQQEKEEQAAAMPEIKEGTSFFDSALKDIESAPVAVPKERNVAVLSEIVSKANHTSTPMERESLNSRFKVDIPKPAQEHSYGHVSARVDSIAGSIPLGQRFMFVNQLFNKNSEHFDKAIYELDSVKSFDEAKDLIWHRYASKYAWDVNGEAVTTLLSIVKRKFQ